MAALPQTLSGFVSIQNVLYYRNETCYTVTIDNTACDIRLQCPSTDASLSL